MKVYDFWAKTIDGKQVPLSSYQGKILLIVNVASNCGFTQQYHGLENLYQKYKDRGFVILAFPCNQFGAQEPGNEIEIKNFCESNFGVKFPLFSKIEVNGPNAHPLYQFLVRSKPGILGIEEIKWNFTKFLTDREGYVIKRFAPITAPGSIDSEINTLLIK